MVYRFTEMRTKRMDLLVEVLEMHVEGNEQHEISEKNVH